MRYNHVVQMEKYYAGIYTNVDLSDCKALEEFEVSEVPDPCDNPDQLAENGEYLDCDDPDDPEVYPDSYPDNTGPNIEGPGTSNNMKQPTTKSPKQPSQNNVVKEPVKPTNSGDGGGNN